MFCKYCGNQLENKANFCNQCGKAVKENSTKKFTIFSDKTKKIILNFIRKIIINIPELLHLHSRLITIVMSGMIILITILSFGNKKGNTYKQAMNFMESGEYIQAAELFQELGDYKESSLQYKKARYSLAEALLSEGNYQEAAEIYHSLRDYQDADMQYNNIRYQQAKKMTEQGQEDEALLICEELLDLNYKTSDVQFLKGNILLKQGNNYQNALNLFEKLSINDYDGADEMIKKTRYEWAKDLIRQNQKLEALEMFDMISEYADVKECQRDLAEEIYTEAQGYYRSGRYQKAQDYFSKLYTSHIDTTYYLRLTSIYLEIDQYGYDNANELFIDPQWSFYLDDFRENFYVEDTAEAMLSCTNLACAYLLGEWRTSNNSHYFKIVRNEDGNDYNFYSYYNIPWYEGDYFVIKDGTYYTVKDEKEIVMYRMKLTGPDTLEIYAAKNGNTYTLTRKNN